MDTVQRLAEDSQKQNRPCELVLWKGGNCWDRRNEAWSKSKPPEEEHVAFPGWFSSGHSPQIIGFNQVTENSVGSVPQWPHLPLCFFVAKLACLPCLPLFLETGFHSSVLANLEISRYDLLWSYLCPLSTRIPGMCHHPQLSLSLCMCVRVWGECQDGCGMYLLVWLCMHTCFQVPTDAQYLEFS